MLTPLAILVGCLTDTDQIMQTLFPAVLRLLAATATACVGLCCAQRTCL